MEKETEAQGSLKYITQGYTASKWYNNIMSVMMEDIVKTESRGS